MKTLLFLVAILATALFSHTANGQVTDIEIYNGFQYVNGYFGDAYGPYEGERLRATVKFAVTCGDMGDLVHTLTVELDGEHDEDFVVVPPNSKFPVFLAEEYSTEFPIAFEYVCNLSIPKTMYSDKSHEGLEFYFWLDCYCGAPGL